MEQQQNVQPAKHWIELLTGQRDQKKKQQPANSKSNEIEVESPVPEGEGEISDHEPEIKKAELEELEVEHVPEEAQAQSEANNEKDQSPELENFQSEKADSETTGSGSSVWKHFIKNKSKAEISCKYCSKILSINSSTSTLQRHYDRKHFQVKGQKSINDYTKLQEKPEKPEQLSQRLLIQWIVNSMRPFNIVLNPDFKEFIKSLNPKFTLPSYEMLKNKSI